MSDGTEVTKESLNKLRVVDLKQELTKLGLSTHGLKADLVERLFEYHLSQNVIAEPDEATDEESQSLNGGDSASSAATIEENYQNEVIGMETSGAGANVGEEDSPVDMSPVKEELSPVFVSQPAPAPPPQPAPVLHVSPAALHVETSPAPPMVSPKREREVPTTPPQLPSPTAAREVPRPMLSPQPDREVPARPLPTATPKPAQFSPSHSPMQAESAPAPPSRSWSPPRERTPPPIHRERTPPPKPRERTPPPKQRERTPPPKQRERTPPPRQRERTPPPRPVEKTPPPKPKATPPPPAQPVEARKEIIQQSTTEVNGKLSKDKKKKKKKKRRARQREDPLKKKEKENDGHASSGEENEDDVEIEYVQEKLDLKEAIRDPLQMAYFNRVFDAFRMAAGEGAALKGPEGSKFGIGRYEEDQFLAAQKDKQRDVDEQQTGDDKTAKLSKKQMRKLTRMSVAQLKQLVIRPDLVEMHDVTAKDPIMLLQMKSTRNTVPVPRHWCYKRKYLAGKRGFIKPPFQLPEFIKKTGIQEMREALQEKEAHKSLKSKMRERIRPKVGKIDIDYQKLHDAFFRWQTKPKMTIHGDLYYEGKEFETRLRAKKPGNLSDELRTALGMPTGPNAEKVPPPWLIAMQRYGPPPSYPNLKIPGLNAPIPEGCSFGYHAGGWGKPPVDEYGKPLYGDVFGSSSGDIYRQHAQIAEEEVERTMWGAMESESSASESESEEEEETLVPPPPSEMPSEQLASGMATPAEGLATPSGLSSVTTGMQGLETPESIELRKRRIEAEMERGEDNQALYTVLPERASSVGGAMMGSTKVYDMSAAAQAAAKRSGKVTMDGVEVALNPDELDLDAGQIEKRYEQQMREKLEKEDLSDMVAEHAAKQSKKRKKQAEGGKSNKKQKEFKF